MMDFSWSVRGRVIAGSAAFGVVMLAGSFSAAQQTSTDYDHAADFTKYHTFSFDKVQTENPLNVQRVKGAVTRDLAARGIQEVASGGDVTVTAIGDTKSEQEYNTFYDGLGGRGFGWRGGWRGGFGGDSQTTVQQIPVGTLLLDMYDSGTHQLVWRGSATADLSSKADKNAKTLDKAVDKMLDSFRPRGRSKTSRLQREGRRLRSPPFCFWVWCSNSRSLRDDNERAG